MSDNTGKDKLNHFQSKRSRRRKVFKKYFGLKDEKMLTALIGKYYLFEDEVGAKKRNNLPKFPRIKSVFQPRKRISKELSLMNDININEESIYTDSTAFLKGTQSSNPHNDYSQYFVDTGQRPQNFIRDTGLKNRFEEYPKLRELIRLKDNLIADTGNTPMYLKEDLSSFNLTDLQTKFDVILIEPPLEEYNRMNGAVYDKYWSWPEIEALEIDQISAQRSFVWLWCGSGQGLNEGRKCLSKWGFRRCEDICWIKTNKKRPGHKNLEPGALFQRTKEHCLMGIKGTVRRSTDGDFIHANVDIDLIIDEEPVYGVKDKPVEIFHIIEHFCLGKRRLHLFGRDSNIRQGWLTIGSELTSSNFDNRVYNNFFTKEPNGTVVPYNEEIERLRPKSPPPRQKTSTSQQSNVPSSASNHASNYSTSNSAIRNCNTSDSSSLDQMSSSNNSLLAMTQLLLSRAPSNSGGGIGNSNSNNNNNNSSSSNSMMSLLQTPQNLLAANLAMNVLSQYGMVGLGNCGGGGLGNSDYNSSSNSMSNLGPNVAAILELLTSAVSNIDYLHQHSNSGGGLGNGMIGSSGGGGSSSKRSNSRSKNPGGGGGGGSRR